MSNYQYLINSFRELGVDVSQKQEDILRCSTDESVFEVTPQLVITPHDAQELEQVVRVVRDYRTTHQDDIALTVRAAGTGLSGGSLNDSITVDILRLKRIGEIKPEGENGYLWVEPGTMFKDLDKFAVDKGYFFPPYPSSRDICTIGGMVANNAAGPNSLKYGHTSDFVRSLKVILSDGKEYTIGPKNWQQLERELEQQNALGEIYRFVWNLIEKDFEGVKRIKPDSAKNSAGYELWDVLSAPSTDAFKNGEGEFNLIHIFCGSQGTLGVITDIECKLIPKKERSDLMIIAVHDIKKMGEQIQKLLPYDPYNIEIFDDKTYKLALKNPGFFKSFYNQDDFKTSAYPEFVRTMYWSWIKRFYMKSPKFVLMVKFDGTSSEETNKTMKEAYDMMRGEYGKSVQLITDDTEEDMFWRVRASSYTLAKFQQKNTRPAAFLEDMTVPAEYIPSFLETLQDKLENEYKVQYAVHGHGGNGHFHFYPLFDFTNPDTPAKIFRMAEDFYTLAEKHKGNICGEHNDGIMRTPFLDKIFSLSELEIFKQLEKTADPLDMWNPGKKVNPKFDIRETIRRRN